MINLVQKRVLVVEIRRLWNDDTSNSFTDFLTLNFFLVYFRRLIWKPLPFCRVSIVFFLNCRRCCQSRCLQWQTQSKRRAVLGGRQDGGERPVEQQSGVHPVGGRLHHRPGKYVALSLPLLQERRRWVQSTDRFANISKDGIWKCSCGAAKLEGPSVWASGVRG